MTNRPPGRRKRRTGSHRTTAPPLKVSGWWVGGPVIAMLLLGLTVVLFLRPPPETEKKVSGESPAYAAPDVSELLAGSSDWQSPLPIELARLFTKATTHAARLALIANPSKDGYWMEKFFNGGPGAEEKVLSVTPMGLAITDTTSFERFQVGMEDGGNRLLCIVITDQGGKVDFRSYARFCSESWEDLLSGKTNIAEETRVFIESGTAYLQDFSDDLKWTSYIATSPDTEKVLYLYALRDSETDRLLQEMTIGEPVRVTLAIRSTAEAWRHRQFEVTKFITAGWVK